MVPNGIDFEGFFKVPGKPNSSRHSSKSRKYDRENYEKVARISELGFKEIEVVLV